MKKLISTIALATALLLASAPSLAQESNDYKVTGVGANKCYAYLENVQADDDLHFMFTSWAQGFITFKMLLNEEGGTRAELEVDFLNHNLTNYCEGNPEQDFIMAVMAHVTSVTKNRSRP